MKISSTTNAIRSTFVVLSTLLGSVIANEEQLTQSWNGAIYGAIFALSILLIDFALRNFTIRGFSAGTFGLLVGMVCAQLIVWTGVFEGSWMDRFPVGGHIFGLGLFIGFGYLGMMLALRTKRDEFSLIIPYVRFRQDSVHDQSMLIDTNVIIDGRLLKLCATGFLSGSLIVPQFVLDELQALSDSDDEAKRGKGKRGLDCLRQMQDSPELEVIINDDSVIDKTEVDAKLVDLAQRLGARLMTNDSGLAKVARLQKVNVLLLSELTLAMRPVVSPGDEVELNLIKEGRDEHQAVGYLPDGTMIVVNRAVELIGSLQWVIVAGAVQTSAGRLIFAELKEND
ncbi:MAG: hypothetical protein L3J39_07490 [Verrucomicrobiales bacterium]|nr:hypothetical protein [Verrucomicrobiales bacterium]